MERYNVHDEYMTPSEAGNVVLHADAQRALDAERRERRAVEQIAGQALGYPWFKDDQKNFPGATEADGVCIGEHVAGTIVQELASKLATLQAQAYHTRIERNRLWGELADLQAQLADRDAMILQMGKQAARLAKDGIAAKAQLRQVEGENQRLKEAAQQARQEALREARQSISRLFDENQSGTPEYYCALLDAGNELDRLAREGVK